MQHLGPDEAKRFLEAAEDDSFYPLFLLALTTACDPASTRPCSGRMWTSRTEPSPCNAPWTTNVKYEKPRPPRAGETSK